jgi:paraquat-inducible protein B
MSEQQPAPPPDAEIPEAVVRQRRWPVALVWVVPILAILFGAWLALSALWERGPTITITFKTAEGIEAGKTRIKYKNVDIGEVKRLDLTKDRTGVIVTAQVRRQAADLLVEDTRFWVVRPRVSAGSVTGLGTLLSGSHIGLDAGKSTEDRRDFVGLEQPAIVTADLPGRVFVLKGEDLGSLDVGSPIYFRHIEAGQVAAFELDPDGKAVTVRVFVNAPYDKHVNANTRFWHADGFDVTLDANGLKVNTQSIVSILLGGLAFETPPDAPPAPPASTNAVFKLFSDRDKAFRPSDGEYETYVMVFKESVRGLAPGAPIDFRGVVVGEVVAIDLDFDRASRSITVPVTVRIDTAKLLARRSNANAERKLDTKTLLDRMVQRGFRAQVRTASLVTNQLFVALDFFPDAAKGTIDWSKAPPEIPTMTGSLQELQVSIVAIAKKLEKVPFDDIGKDLRTTLRSANQLIEQLDKQTAPELKTTLEEARRALRSVEATAKGLEATVAPDAPLQQDLRGSLNEISRAAQALRALSDYLERHPEALIRGKRKDEP